ncbi:MAG TPA: DoxX family protein [Flavisolibacter sp.]|nr:DoxX family protein [Flavisolibacter sp.]
MQSIFSTNPLNTSALVARLALAIVVFPHGAQKLLGWFGGHGFSGTMAAFKGMMGLPYIIALLVILVEFFGPLLLLIGLATRIAALAILGEFIGIVVFAHIYNGFFMNWAKQGGKGEGLEYFFLLFGLTIILLIDGGGRGSIDAVFGHSEMGIRQ